MLFIELYIEAGMFVDCLLVCLMSEVKIDRNALGKVQTSFQNHQNNLLLTVNTSNQAWRGKK